MYTRKKRIRRTLVDFAIEIVGLVLLAVFLFAVQTNLSVNRQQDNSLTKLSVARQRMELNAAEATENLATYDAFGQAKIDTVAYFLSRNPEYASPATFAAQWGLTEFYVLDASRASSGPDFTDESVFGALFGEGTPVSVGSTRYYASVRPSGGWWVGGRDCSLEDAKLAQLVAPKRALETIKVGTDGFIFAVDAEGRIVYHRDETMIGRDAADAGYDPALYPDRYADWLTLDGSRMYCIAQDVAGYRFAAILPEAELTAYNVRMVIPMLAVFAIVCTLLIAYALILRNDAAKHPRGEDSYWKLNDHLYLDKTIAVRLRSIAVIGLVAVFLLSFYIQTLVALSRQSQISDTKLQAVESILDDNETRLSAMTQEYTDEYARRARNIAYTLSQDPTLVDDAALTELAQYAQIKALYVFNTAGRTVATNTNYKDFALGDDENDQSYPFWDVVKGHVDLLVQEPRTDDTSEHAYIQYVGVRRLDADGMVQLGISPQRLSNRLRTTELDYVLRNIAVENGGSIFAVDPATGLFVSHPNAKYIGRLAADYGLTAAAMRDEFMGYQTIDGVECLTSCMEKNGLLFYISVPTAGIVSARVSVALIVTLAGLLVLLGVSAFLLLGGQPQKDAEPPTERPSRFFRLLSPSGHSRVVQSAASRWNGTSQPWEERTPEQKMSRLTSLLMSAAALALVAYLWLFHGASHKDGVIGYILSMRWEKGFNLFAYSYIAIVLLEVIVLSTLARRLILMVARRFGGRSETIGQLFDNFIKYLAVLGAVFYCLSFLGLDSGTLLASAGILTLIVGLGAQSLIKDVLAGMFIVFEGEFRVGDIVTIGDWRGTVLEIGIRTTKVESVGSDIKIFNNSAITSIVNMTRQYSYAFTDMTVKSNESLEHVESVLDKELPAIASRLSAVTAGPYYKGVISVGADLSSVIRVIAQCRENDRIQLTRDLNRELKLLFEHYEINNPHPTAPAAAAPAQPAQEKATKSEKKQAAAFVKEQKELSQDIQVHDN